MEKLQVCYDCDEEIQSNIFYIKDTAGVIYAYFCKDCFKVREKDGYDYKEDKER